VLGWEETAGYSPRVQEMAALLASKMPVSEASTVLEHLTERRLKWCKGIIFASTRTGWITARDGVEANRLAAERLSQPVGKPNAALSARVNTGASAETNRCCAWKRSGATVAGTCSSPHNRQFDHSKKLRCAPSGR
jgi:hypothetical protein